MKATPYTLQELVRTRTVLITGAPNFVAIQLIWRILEVEPATEIHLIVRGDQIVRTEEFLSRNPGLGYRVNIHRGSTTEPNFGLHEDTFRVLASTVDDVYHMAGMYHLGVDPLQVEEVNIRGTRLALDAIRRFTNLNRFHYYSTAFVSGAREGVILEEDLEQGQTFRSTFERTRFTAEMDVRRARLELPITVYRSSLVVGDSRTGEIHNLDGPWIFLQAIARNPDRLPTILPNSTHFPFNVVPVDYVAHAMHALSLRPDTAGKTFHLVDPSPVSQASGFRLLWRHVNEGPVKSNFQSQLRERLLRIPLFEKITRDSRDVYNELDNLQIFNAANTLKGLTGTGIHCPFFPDYVAKLVDFARSDAHGWLRQPLMNDDELSL